MQNYTVRFNAMGCTVQAWLSANNSADAARLRLVPLWFEAWEASFSRFRPESELSALNQHAGEWVSVSGPLYEVIASAVAAAKATDGLFNPLILPALESAGYDHSFDQTSFIPGPRQQPPPAIQVADGREIKLNADQIAVRLPANSRIDLGGIAKGWAIDQAVYQLSEFGPCMVDAGGDLAAVGSPDDSGGWLVTVPDPRTEEILYTLSLTDRAIASSGTDYRQWTRDGQHLHHIIDPRTGEPAESPVLSASVVAPDATQAVVWAKTALIRGTASAFPTLLFGQDGSTTHNREFEALCKPAVNYQTVNPNQDSPNQYVHPAVK